MLTVLAQRGGRQAPHDPTCSSWLQGRRACPVLMQEESQAVPLAPADTGRRAHRKWRTTRLDSSTSGGRQAVRVGVTSARATSMPYAGTTLPTPAQDVTHQHCCSPSGVTVRSCACMHRPCVPLSMLKTVSAARTLSEYRPQCGSAKSSAECHQHAVRRTALPSPARGHHPPALLQPPDMGSQMSRSAIHTSCIVQVCTNLVC